MMKHSLRKQLGQHFLSDPWMIQQIIASIAPEPHQHLVEIGPGQGALTLPLLKIINQMDAIEIDKSLVNYLKLRVKNQLNIFNESALSFNFTKLIKDNEMLRIFGNLPYSISTPLIFHLLEFTSIIQDMVFMLQKEVALRMAASPNTHAYGRLSIMTQYHCQCDLLFEVGAQAFNPPPKVDSYVIRLSPYRSPPYFAKNYLRFAHLVKEAFSKRRKTLRQSLKSIVPPSIWEKLAIDSGLRPENLSVKDFVNIANVME